MDALFGGLTRGIAAGFIKMALANIEALFMQHAVAKELSLKEIATNAAKAASGAFSAVAAIPYVGPVLAPIAAAAAFAGTMAFGAYAAEGGFDVPPNIAPVTQLHPREMVLPANLADSVRNMTGQGGGGDTHHHYNVNAMDSRSMVEHFTAGGSSSPLARAMQTLHGRRAFQ